MSVKLILNFVSLLILHLEFVMKKTCLCNLCSSDGRVVRVYASGAVDPGLIPSLVKLVLPPGKLGREISWEIWGFEISRFPGNLCWKFFYISRGFSGTDIYHFDIKNVLLQI